MTPYKELSPREIEDGMVFKCATQEQIAQLYQSRERYVAFLVEKNSIDGFDIGNLDRLGKVVVAIEYWEICTSDARQLLLNDPHPHIKSAALIINDEIANLN